MYKVLMYVAKEQNKEEVMKVKNRRGPKTGQLTGAEVRKLSQFGFWRETTERVWDKMGREGREDELSISTSLNSEVSLLPYL